MNERLAAIIMAVALVVPAALIANWAVKTGKKNCEDAGGVYVSMYPYGACIAKQSEHPAEKGNG